jgi:DNA modification methylase
VETNRLFYGDNLEILQRYIPDESVDLVYLDPPFNSNRSYSAIFADESGRKSDAQIGAFEDSWHWGPTAEHHYAYLTNSAIHQGKVPAAASSIVAALRFGIGETPMLAYIVEMTIRLVELHRVVKPTGSLYLHCDPTASHYLKVVLDGIFGPANFVAELIWQRTNARGTTGRWPRLHDVILQYSRTARFAFSPVRVPADASRMPHTLVPGPGGLRYQSYELTAPGRTAEGDSGLPWRGFEPGTYGRHWANTALQREEWNELGLIHWPPSGGWPRRRGAEPFRQEDREIVVGDVWTDIDRLNQTAKERLGYPTQKPLALLERIIEASSNPGDVVLDPFCGCGTALVAAQKLGRRWIGIDITYLSIAVMRARLRDAVGVAEVPVIGKPTEVEGARMLAETDANGRYEFQWWALEAVGALPAGDERKKGSDLGIDGRITFTEANGAQAQVIVSVKSGKPKADDVRVLKSVVDREKAAIGILVSLEEPTKPMRLEATIAGTYWSESAGREFPKIQLLSAADLLERGLRPQLPPLVSAPYQRAARVPPKVDQGELFRSS